MRLASSMLRCIPQERVEVGICNNNNNNAKVAHYILNELVQRQVSFFSSKIVTFTPTYLFPLIDSLLL